MRHYRVPHPFNIFNLKKQEVEVVTPCAWGSWRLSLVKYSDWCIVDNESDQQSDSETKSSALLHRARDDVGTTKG